MPRSRVAAALTCCLSLAVFLGPAVHNAAAGTVAAGMSHTLVVKTTDSTVWAWGLNSDGQLGDNTVTQRKTPIQVTSLSGVVAVAAGAKHSLALKSDGSLWAWGDNVNGQVGNGTTTDQTLPVQVLTGVSVVAAGDYHTVALKLDGTVWTWGLNGDGQLGDGGTTSRSSPAQVTGLGLVGAIAGGGNHTVVVLQAGGAMKAWGKNANGQLGDGTTTGAKNPVSVSGVSNAVMAVGGGAFTLARKNDATLLAWGLNSSGQLGLGDTTQRKTATAVAALTNVATMAAGLAHGVALLGDASVRAWGRNTYGNIGDGSTTQRNSPVAVSSLASITAIGAGQNHNVAVTTTGEVWAWGYNTAYQIGDGTNVNRTTPVKIAEAGFQWRAGTPTISPAAGIFNVNKTVTMTTATSGGTIRYTTDGTDPTASSTAYSAALSVTVSTSFIARTFKTGLAPSNPATATYTLKALPPTFTPAGGSYTSAQTVTLGTTTTGATIRYTTDGTDPTPSSAAYTGPLAVGSSTTIRAAAFKTGWTTSDISAATYTFSFGPLPAPMVTPASGTYLDSVTVGITATSGATIHYTTDGSDPSQSSAMYSAPFALQGTAEVRTAAWKPDYDPSPVTTATYAVKLAPPVLSKASGTYPSGSTVTVTSASVGAVVHFTESGSDPLETHPTVASGGSILIGTFTLKVRAFKAGCSPSDIVSATYATGSGQVSTGDAFSVAVTPSGQVFAWGINASGQIGDGTGLTAALPKEVAGLPTAVSVAAGAAHVVVATSDGSVWTWGANGSGQIGDGSTTQHSTPFQIPGLGSVSAVSAGGAVSAAIKSDRSLWMWGANASGQLGLGDTTPRSTPQLVMNDVAEVAVGELHTVVRKTDGSVWAWGFNDHGEVGDGTGTTRLSPVPVGLTQVTRVAAGEYHSLALRADGSVWSWGDNPFGQLGDGTFTQRRTPVRVPGFLAVESVAAGRDFSVIAKADGSAWAWGRNESSQLGDGTTTGRPSPVRVGALTNIQAVTAGTWHGAAVAADGSVWAWGYNSYSRLGDGTDYNRISPVSVADVDFRWRAGTPMVDHYTGTTYTPFVLGLSSASAAGVIRYTLDGSLPTTGSTAYSTPIAIDRTTTVKAVTFVPGVPDSNLTAVSFEMKVQPPSFTPGGGTYTAAQNVTITTATGSAAIRYTTDGQYPNASSTPYTGAINVGSQTTLSARAFKDGWTDSDVRFTSYSFNLGTLPAPTVTPAPGTYSGSVSVTLSAPPGATIRYTTDGATPTGASLEYLGPVVVTENATVKAIALRQDWTSSPVTSAAYSIKCSAPVLSLAPGPYPIATPMTVSSPDAGAVTIRYTLDGSAPDASSTTVPAGTTLHLMRGLTVTAVATKANCVDSDATSAAFTVTGTPGAEFVAAGDSDSVAFTAGLLWAWGSNGWGKLGIGDGTSPYWTVPKQVVWSGMPALLAVGANHKAAVASNGLLQCWGSNDWYQLGDTGGPRIQPAPCGGFAAGSVIAGAAGNSHTLAALANGTVYAWGGGGSGQLGDGSTPYKRSTPGPVSNLSGIVKVAASENQSFAIDSSGFAWAWGYNNNGQLGVGDTGGRSTPAPVLVVSNVIAVAPGYSHTLALTSAGRVYSWGGNWIGQLGDGTTYQRAVPAVVPALTGVVAIAAGESYSAALRSDGTVWVWGTGGHGEIGDGLLHNESWPKRVAGVEKVMAIAAGRYHLLALSKDGVIWGWGGNGNGEIGDGTREQHNVPVAISVPGGGWVVATPTISATSGTFSYELDTTVSCATTGATIRYTTTGLDPTAADPAIASGGALHVGVSTTLKARAFLGAASSSTATAWYELRVTPPGIYPGGGTYGNDVDVTMTADSGVTIRYTTDGSDPTETSTAYSVPVPITGSLAVKARGFRSGWTASGTNTQVYSTVTSAPVLAPAGGYIAAPTVVSVSTATAGAVVRYTLDGSEPTLASTVVTGGQVTVAESATLRVRAWRSGWVPSTVVGATFSLTRGQTSAPTLSPAGGTFSQPQQVTLAAAAGAVVRYTLDGSDPVWSSPLYVRPLLVSETTTVKARAWLADWSESPVAVANFTVDYGQALMPTFGVPAGRYATRRVVTVGCPTTGSAVRYTTSGADPGDTDTLVACGGSITVGRSSILKARAWKAGIAPSAVHEAVYEIDGMVAAGWTHSLALDAEGRLWVWGANGNGQLGDGSTTSRTSPFRLPAFGVSAVAAIAAGKSHSLALTEDGRVWAWGWNDYGQLGDGTNSQRTSPLQLPAFSASPVVAIAAGEVHSVALTQDGRVWVWGGNYYGQLGDGGWSTGWLPHQLSQFSTAPVVGVACGTGHTLALAADGGVWAWGYGQAGALGDGSGWTLNAPVRAASLARAVAIAAGQHSVALTSDGGLWAWGPNDYGQVGDGSAVSRFQPVRVAGLRRIQDLAAGGGSSLVSFTDASGAVRTVSWGANLKGQLGDDSTAVRRWPGLVSGLINAVSIAEGEQFSLAVGMNGSVLAWGFNPSGQLGVGTSGDALVPLPVSGVSLVDNTFLTGDPDGDGVPTGAELRVGTDPLVRDTNGDGLDDGTALETSRPPTDPDSDGDGLLNAAEIAAGTDPLKADTDGDGVVDGADPFPLDPTRTSATPNPADHVPPSVNLTQPAGARVIP